jgi:hypothetical protein
MDAATSPPGDVRATTSKRNGRLRKIAYGMLGVALLAAISFTFWYRWTYKVWPGQNVPDRVSWCGWFYSSLPGSAETWRQITTEENLPIHFVGHYHYPPLAWSQTEMFAATYPAAQRAADPHSACGPLIYMRTGPGRYQTYSLEGGG